MRIQHNIAALNSHRQLTNNNSSVSKNLEKLSSGYRINRAGDDAAGLAISEKMRAQITSLNTASKNAQDGISLVQTAEGALTEVHSMLNRMTELAGQAANGTYQNEVDRENAMKELESLRSEIDRISDSTNFNGIKLLDGTMGGGGTGATATLDPTKFGAAKLTFQAVDGTSITITGAKSGTGNKLTSAGNAHTITVDTTAAATLTQSDINKLLKDAGINATVTLDKEITLAANSTDSTGAILSAKAKNATATVGGVAFESTKGGNDQRQITTVASTTDAEGVTVDKNGDITLTLSSTKKYSADAINKILSQGGVKDIKATNKADVTVTANGPTKLAGGAGISGAGLSLQIGESSDAFNQLTVAVKSMSTSSLGIDGVDIGTQDGAKEAVDKIKTAINTVSSTRGDLGAIQNRLEHTINNLGVTAENMTAAESRIRDVDMAQEMMTFTKNNILTQASQAMLAQANQLPQGVLQLLQ